MFPHPPERFEVLVWADYLRAGCADSQNPLIHTVAASRVSQAELTCSACWIIRDAGMELMGNRLSVRRPETAPLDHVLGDARLRDLKPELEQFAVDARRTPKPILPAHLPDQRTQFRRDRRSPSPATRLPTPIAAKAGPMPTYQRFGSNDHDNRKDRREPAIELNEEPAIVVRETSPPLQLTPQDHQLMSERGILSL
jgi:hypothetical protein